MDTLRAWVSSHSDLFGYLALLVVGVLLVARLRNVVRSVKKPVRVPAFFTGPEPERSFARAVWRLNRATRFGPAKGPVGRAARMGLAMALAWGIFSIPILIEVAFRGRYFECGRSSDSVCDWLRAALINPVAAGLMGAIMGIGWPYVRRLWLAITIGIVAVAPFIAQFVAPDPGPLTDWNTTDTAILVAISIPAGSFLGYLMWMRVSAADNASASEQGSSTAPSEAP